jgi:hypothetical protein
VARDPFDVTEAGGNAASRRIRAGVISLVLVGATLSPVVRDPADDGFPLSTYPMFAFPREVVQTIDYAIGETGSGERRAIAPELVGTREVLQAHAVIADAAAAGDAALAALCREIVARAPRDVASVRIVRGTHDAIAFLIGHRVGRERELVRCAR